MFKKMLAVFVLLGTFASLGAKAADDHSFVLSAGYHEEFFAGARVYFQQPSGSPVWSAPFESKAAYLQLATQEDNTLAELRFFVMPELAIEIEGLVNADDANGWGVGVEYYLTEDNPFAVGARVESFDAGADINTNVIVTLETVIDKIFWLNVEYAMGDNEGLMAEAKFFFKEFLYVGARYNEDAHVSLSATDMLHQAGGNAALIGYEHEGIFDVELAIGEDSTGVVFNLRF